MSHLPINPLSPEEQQKIMEQMYLLIGKQVQSYYKHRHMGNNTSVPVELAQELMASIEYTAGLAGGACTRENLEEGQEILKNRLGKAKSMLELVNGTAPQWQTECRWEALHYLRHYLEHYDYLHLAHKAPEGLFYPILISPPDSIRGIDNCIFILSILWIENQIMAGVSDDALEKLWERLPADALNQCEYLLINGIGKAMLYTEIDSLVFEPKEYPQLLIALMHATEDSIKSAALRLCKWLDLKNENAVAYVQAIMPQLCKWIGDNVCNVDMGNLFI